MRPKKGPYLEEIYDKHFLNLIKIVNILCMGPETLQDCINPSLPHGITEICFECSVLSPARYMDVAQPVRLHPRPSAPFAMLQHSAARRA